MRDDVDAKRAPLGTVRRSDIANQRELGSPDHAGVGIHDGEEGRDLPPGSDPVGLVRKFLSERDLTIAFNGSFMSGSAERAALSPDQVSDLLGREDMDETSLLDDLLLDCSLRGVKLSKGLAQAALRQVVRSDRRERAKRIMEPLFVSLNSEERSRARIDRDRLAGLFEDDEGFAVAILEHFIWQVKRKQIGREISYHLMPIIFGVAQGSGKTTFVLHFLRPLQELATEPVLLSEFADARMADLYRYPVVFVDDVGAISPQQVPALKSLITGAKLRRRRLGSSMSNGIAQRSTLIGTANIDIERLVPDDTGHRRFAQLRFRNGQAASGGDPGIWDIVSSIDYGLLWRSVDAFGGSPLHPYLDKIVNCEARVRPNPLREWLLQLDLDRDVVRQIESRKGVRAQGLFELYLYETGADVTLSAFGAEMRRHAYDPDTPFGPKTRDGKGYVYPVKRHLGQASKPAST